MTTKRKPAVHSDPIIDVELEEEAPKAVAKPDPRLCTCANVERRWDVDGLVETTENGGTRFYRCSACGKLYTA